jgi:glycosyltransferase involved in cell wall biosynthesis
VLLRAFAKVMTQLPEARLLLAGDGPERERLKGLIATLGLSGCVTMSGHLPRQEMEHHFAGIWVQAIPSRWAEPFGLVAAEAMMRGTAVVASRDGGLAEIVRHGQTGLLVPLGDVDALAEALFALLQNRQLAEQMGRAGRQVAQTDYSEEACIDKFIQLYQTLLGGGCVS